MDIPMSIPLDAEGFLARECPHCENEFKLEGEALENYDSIRVFCPNCGLYASPSTFMTKRQVAYAQALVLGHVTEVIDKQFKHLERGFRGSRFVSFKHKPLDKPKVRKLREIVDLAIVTLACCAQRVKVPFLTSVSAIYCPYCGLLQR